MHRQENLSADFLIHALTEVLKETCSAALKGPPTELEGHFASRKEVVLGIQVGTLMMTSTVAQIIAHVTGQSPDDLQTEFGIPEGLRGDHQMVRMIERILHQNTQ